MTNSEAARMFKVFCDEKRLDKCNKNSNRLF